MLYFDPIYILFIIPGLLIGLLATFLLKIWTAEYFSVRNLHNVNGLDAASKLGNLISQQFRVELSDGDLNDNYNPATKTLTLSREVALTPSIASLAIAAHEVGHLAQHAESSLLFGLRTMLASGVGFSTNIGYFMLIIGLILQFSTLAWVGLFFFAAATVFSLLTLPLELDASRRAINLLKRADLVFEDELGGVKKVLFAASLTYVAALAQSLGQFLYFFLQVRGIGSRDRD